MAYSSVTKFIGTKMLGLIFIMPYVRQALAIRNGTKCDANIPIFDEIDIVDPFPLNFEYPSDKSGVPFIST